MKIGYIFEYFRELRKQWQPVPVCEEGPSVSVQGELW